MSQNPAYDDEIANLTTRFEHRGESACVAALQQMQAIYAAKDSDYAADGKPMGNLRSSEEVGIAAWKGTLIRLGDKKRRLESFIAKGSFAVDEKIEDTLQDASNYSLLMLVLYLEARKAERPAQLGEYGDARRSSFDLLTNVLAEEMRAVAMRAVLCSTQAENWTGEDWERLKAHYETITAHARGDYRPKGKHSKTQTTASQALVRRTDTDRLPQFPFPDGEIDIA